MDLECSIAAGVASINSPRTGWIFSDFGELNNYILISNAVVFDPTA